MELSPRYPIETARLRLRPLTADDTADLLDYRSRPDVCRWVPFEPMTASTIAERLEGPWARIALDAEGQSLTLGIELAESGRVVGDVILFFHSVTHRGGEIGYVVNPDFAGHGYATEAVRALLELAFADLGLHRVIARIDARNEASARLAARVGMRREAHLRQNEWFKGEWADELNFALLAAEWRDPTAS
jgi:RimJ/RimL family protein N-acetyltransferase